MKAEVESVVETVSLTLAYHHFFAPQQISRILCNNQILTNFADQRTVAGGYSCGLACPYFDKLVRFCPRFVPKVETKDYAREKSQI